MSAPTRSPVLVGLGTATRREEDPRLALDPLALMVEAARGAGRDCGAPALLGRVGRVAVPKGRWSNGDPARAIARAIGAERATSVLSTVGVLQQTLIGDACDAVASGTVEAALVVGGDAGYRILRARIEGVELPPPDRGGAPDVLMAPREDLRHPAELRAGLAMPVGLYAVMESAYRAARGWTVEEHRDRIAALTASLSAVAAANPRAWSRRVVAADAIRNATDRNPLQAFPYNKLHCSSWNVDQAAALLVCSARIADEFGIAEHLRVHPWASVESNHMVAVCARPDLAGCPGAGIAAEAALAPFGLSAGRIDLLELYSCFPVAVEATAAAIGVDIDRPLTVTGGMPFAGGPYNNYVLQATCRMAELLRSGAGRTGLVSSVSGILTKQGIGLWGAGPAEGGYRSADVTDAVARAVRPLPVEAEPDEVGRVAGYTVLADRGRPAKAVVVADLANGRRAVAASPDPALLAALQEREFCGAPIRIRGDGFEVAA